MRKRIIVLYLFLLFIISCSSKQTGVFQGKISIGPLCPVEQNLPDPKCSPNAETFKAWPIGIYSGNNLIQTVTPDGHGNFRVELMPGTYEARLESQQGIGGGNLPFVLTIKAGMNLTQDIGIDTGIR